MFKSSVIVAAVLAVASAQLQLQHPSPYFSLGGGGGGPASPSPFSGIGPSSSPYGRPGGPGHYSGRPGGFPGSKPPRSNAPSKLFSWLGSTMAKIPGLSLPKIHYHPGKPSKPSSLQGLSGPLSISSSAQNAPPTYFSSGGPPRESLILPQIPNSIYEGPLGGPGGSKVTFAPTSNSINHPPVHYRSPVGPPPSFGSPSPFGPRPGPPQSSPFGSRPPPSFGGSRPGPSPAFSFSSGGPSYSSGRPGPSPFSSSPFSVSESPFGPGPSPSASRPFSIRPVPQNTQNNLEVFPSQQLTYQSQTLTQNEPGYNEALSGLQNLYGSQPNGKPSFAALSTYEQQSSYSRPQPFKTSGNNYGATFHSIEPVRVAPMYDIADNFKPSSTDLASAGSQQPQKQSGNIHDTPFANIVNDYAAHADAATAGSSQLLTALQSAGADLMSAATTNQPIPGVQILGNGDGNPMFEVVANGDAPTYDGHPVDLTKLISMIEPGAQIDTIPNYGSGAQNEAAASEPQPVYAEAPPNMELDSEAAMSGILSGNLNSKTLMPYQHHKTYHLSDKFDGVGVASESRPTVVKPDGTRLSDDDDTLIKKHFDKDLILDDDLQGSNESSGFIIVGVKSDDDSQTGDFDDNPDGHLQGTEYNTNNSSQTISSFRDKTSLKNSKDLIAIVQQLRQNAGVVTSANRNSEIVSDSKIVTEAESSTHHPHHNYDPLPAPPPQRVPFESKVELDSQTRDSVPVINPIFDSVRPGRTMSIRTSVKSSTSVETDTPDYSTNDNDQTSSASNRHRQFHLVDIDDEDMLPDDFDTESEGDDGDLAMSASRNVKSVAIIVTPPPHYVKIKNKYKKEITPLSALSSTTHLPPHPEEEGESSGSRDSSNTNVNSEEDPLASESVRSSLDSSISASAPTPSSSLEKDNGSGKAHEHDAIIKKLIKGRDDGKEEQEKSAAAEERIFSPSVPSPSPSHSIEAVKRPRLYPVYRRKMSS